MALVFTTATIHAAHEIVALHEAVAQYRRLELKGARAWNVPSLRSLVASMPTSESVLAHDDAELVASFRLDPARGFLGDAHARFTEVQSSVYLLEMAVHPSHRSRGVGRLCLDEAARRARERGAQAIRLDTNDDEARAASFYLERVL
jgi:ribosomal protein S18 acetylase RimI-like enzyme